MKRLIVFIPIALVVLLIGITTATASTNWQRINESPQSGASTDLSTGYDLSWYTLDGGGGSSSGGGYSLSGTIGQPDAGTVSGGGYTLLGGFWGGSNAPYNIYLPLIVKQ